MSAPAALPLIHLSQVWHLGTMNAADKSNFSYEGDGLSVSVHPDDWEAIARLGGLPRWKLTKPGGTFLDYHLLDDTARARIETWGVDCGYIENRSGFEVRWTDDDDDAERWLWFPTREKAEDECGELDQPALTASTRPVATAAFPERLVKDGEVGIEQLLAVVWCRQTLPGLDGVWFDDNYRPAHLSCPRGVLHPGKISTWSATLEHRDDPVR